MDPVSLGAVLLAVISGAGGGLGTQLWASVEALVNRPFRHRHPANHITTTPSTGEAELAALRQNPDDEKRAREMAEVLIGRANIDIEFRQALESWWTQARTIHISDGNGTNTISGGTQHGPVLQGRDFGNITFGTTSARASPDWTE